VLASDLLDALRSPFPADALDQPTGGAVVVELGAGSSGVDAVARDAFAPLPCVVVGIGDAASDLAELCDVLLAADHPQLETVLATVATNPLAATALAMLLRGSTDRTVGDGLVAESAAYSTLQGGPEFAAWRATTPVRTRVDDEGSPVRVERSGTRLEVTLTRPQVHNAFDARMRDALLDALSIAVDDAEITEVVLSGDGPSFCSGGDLDEFGSRPDPATAHMVRLARSPARVLARLAPRTTARLHGACMGSGIELPVFAGRVVAHPDTEIGLPEIGMGLVPGAGGTVSLPRRIGRQRTALLALARTNLDAATALEWGLVDEICER